MLLEDKRRDYYPEFQAALSAAKEGKSTVTLDDPYLNELVSFYARGTSKRQVDISFNKWLHDFNVADMDSDIAMMVGEVSEVLEARARRNDYDTALELADVVVYCYGIAQMLGVDLDTAVQKKMDDFFHRTYKPDVEAV